MKRQVGGSGNGTAAVAATVIVVATPEGLCRVNKHKWNITFRFTSN